MHLKDTGSPTLTVDVFDKRKDFPFKVARYPHLDSAIPSSIAYGVFIGQLHRFTRICSTPLAFIRNAFDVASTLGHQKASLLRLKETFSSFCRQTIRRSRWNVSVSSLICFFKDKLLTQDTGPTDIHEGFGADSNKVGDARHFIRGYREIHVQEASPPVRESIGLRWLHETFPFW